MRDLQATGGTSLTADDETDDHTDSQPEDNDTNGDTDSDTDDPPRRTRRGVVALVAVVVLLLDLITKIVVVATIDPYDPVKLAGGFIYLTLVRNSGAAFAFAEGYTLLFTVIACAVVVVIIRVASRLRSAPWAVALGLILGGAVGNLVDRIFRSPGPLRGAVVDWISLRQSGEQIWPVFNLADSGIVVGGVIAVVLVLLGFDVDGSRHRRDK